MADRIQHRRDTAERWASINPVLLEGEIGYVLDNPNQHKIGDGVHRWNELPLRGFTGNISQELGNDENAVISQKAVTEALSDMRGEVESHVFSIVSMWAEDSDKLSKSKMAGFVVDISAKVDFNVYSIEVYELAATDSIATMSILVKANTTQFTPKSFVIELPLSESNIRTTVKKDNLFGDFGSLELDICYNTKGLEDIKYVGSEHHQIKNVTIDGNPYVDYLSQEMVMQFAAVMPKDWIVGIYSKTASFENLSISRYRNDDRGLYMEVTLDGAKEGKWFDLVEGLNVLDFENAVVVIDANRWVGDWYINIPIKKECISSFFNKGLEDKIEDLRKDLGDIESLTYTSGGYIENDSNIVNTTPIVNAYYAYIIIPAQYGDLFTVKAFGTLHARIYSFIDESNNLLKVAAQEEKEAMVFAPKNTAYAIFNTGNSALSYVYKGWRSVQNGMTTLCKTIEELKGIGQGNNCTTFPTTLHNNLIDNGVGNIPNCNVIVDGKSDNSKYGNNNAVYKIDLKERKKLHVYFEYTFDKQMPYVSSNDFKTIFQAYGDAVRVGFVVRDYTYFGNELARYILPGSNNSRIGLTGQFLPLADYNAFNGPAAFWVKYTGQRATSEDYAMCSFENNKVTFSVNSTGEVLGSVSYSNDDSVQSLVDSIASIDKIDCGFINTLGHTCGELLPSLINCQFPLNGDFTDSKKVVHYENAKFNIPYSMDTKTHSFEIMIDLENLCQWESFDGFTRKTNIRDTALTDSSDASIVIGNEYITVKNLQVDYGHYGDAEIVNNIVYPFSTTVEQMISNNNPRLLIFEGHEVVHAVEGDSVLTEYDISTDKITSVFENAKKAGYVPVTWDEVLLWKKNLMKLPKRCYVTMFDDFRFTNYIDCQKRKPFADYGVKAGLSIVSDSYKKTDVMEIDGVEYSVAEVISATLAAGWYVTSHTKDHRKFTDFSSDDLEVLAKEDIYSCNKLGIRSETIVYPYGSYEPRLNAVFRRASFMLGININYKNVYNCKAKNDFNLVRYSFKNEYTLDNICSCIV